MECILYPVFQKFYSVVKNYETLVSSNDFNDVVSAIDSILSELKSFDYTLRKSLGENEAKNMYSMIPDSQILRKVCLYRNKTVHEKPFDLKLIVVGSVFRIRNRFVYDETYYLCDEVSTISDCTNAFFDYLKSVSTGDVYFGVDVIASDSENREDIVLLLKSAVKHLFSLVAYIHDSFHCSCGKCEALYKKAKSKFLKVVVWEVAATSFDGVSRGGEIEIAQMIRLLFCDKNGVDFDCSSTKIPFSGNIFFENTNGPRDLLRRLLEYNALFVPKNFLVDNMLFSVVKVYDDSFTMENYSPDSLAAISRILRRYGEQVRKDLDVVAVIHVSEMVEFDYQGEVEGSGFLGKQSSAKHASLCGHLITKELKESFIRLDESLLHVPGYIGAETDCISYKRFVEASTDSPMYFIKKAFLERHYTQ